MIVYNVTQKVKNKILFDYKIYSKQFIKLDEFEINEIDEDLYTESNCENVSSKKSKKRIDA